MLTGLSGLSGLSGIAGSSGYSSISIPAISANLLAQFPMNELSGAAVDTEGNYTTTQVGTVTAGAGGGFFYRSFSQSAATRFTAATNNAIAGVGNDLSFDFWLRNYASAFNSDVLSIRAAGGSVAMSFIIRISSTSFFSGDGTGTYGSQALTLGANGSWVHYAFAWNTTTKALRYRVNGGTVATLTTTYAPTVNCGLLSIGGYNSATDCSDCDMTALRFYNRVLTDAEMLQLYNSGSPFLLT